MRLCGGRNVLPKEAGNQACFAGFHISAEWRKSGCMEGKRVDSAAATLMGADRKAA